MYVRSSLILTVAAIVMMSSSASAQSAAPAASPATNTPAQMLQPRAVSPLFVPANLHEEAALQHAAMPAQPQPAMVRHRGQGFGLMIAGGALFVAGLLTGGSAGTVMDLAGAG